MKHPVYCFCKECLHELKPANFPLRSTSVKKQSTCHLRDLKKYLLRKEQLEKRYSKSSITFP